MEIVQPTNDIELNGLPTSSYGIGDPYMIMLIVRDRIYRNPLRAMIQEYLSNALDANTEAQTDRPVEITLPDPEFGTSELCIRDFGVGINPDRMTQVFVQYGKSTKRNSNDQIGGFGLGCKTGFAYGDSFTVDTIYETPEGRVQDIWYHFIDPNGSSGYTKITSNTTDEPTGTTIKIPIKDAPEVVNPHIVSVTKHWKVRPVCSLEYPELKVLMQGTDWKIYEGKNEPEFIINGIPYEVNKNEFSEESKAIARVFCHGTTIWFDAHDVSVTASREDIDYKTETKQFILAKIEQIYAEQVIQFENFFGGLNSHQRYAEAHRLGLLEDFFSEAIDQALGTLGLRLLRRNPYGKVYETVLDRTFLPNSIVIVKDRAVGFKQVIETLSEKQQQLTGVSPVVYIVAAKPGGKYPKGFKDLPPHFVQVPVFFASDLKAKDFPNGLSGTGRIGQIKDGIDYNKFEVVDLKKFASYPGALLLKKDGGTYYDKTGAHVPLNCLTHRLALVVPKSRWDSLPDLSLFSTFAEIVAKKKQRQAARNFSFEVEPGLPRKSIRELFILSAYYKGVYQQFLRAWLRSRCNGQVCLRFKYYKPNYQDKRLALPTWKDIEDPALGLLLTKYAWEPKERTTVLHNYLEACKDPNFQQAMQTLGTIII